MFMSDSEMEALFGAVHAYYASIGVEFLIIEEQAAVNSGEIDGIYDWSHHPIYDEMVAEVEVFYVQNGRHVSAVVFVLKDDLRVVPGDYRELPYE